MDFQDKLKELTVHIRKEKGSAEAMRFYIKFIQPIKKYYSELDKKK